MDGWDELDETSPVWAEKFRRSEENAVAYIQTNVPEGIASVEFGWSDQGPYIDVAGYTMADGTKLDVEGYYVDPQGEDESA